jgi:HD-like signal output (HDOD) protein
MSANALATSRDYQLKFPSCPDVVTMLQEEMHREEPDLKRISRKIAADVGLAGAMLKAVNSPAFGLNRKVGAVSQALSLLGLRNVASMATALILKGTLGSGVELKRFWDTAEKAAFLCAFLAQRLRGMPAEEAYTAGLFHDCGIAMLLSHNPGYLGALDAANHDVMRSFTEAEEASVGTNHCAVGYFLARHWSLPDSLCQTILRHHDIDVFSDSSVSGQVCNYIGVIHIAEHIQHKTMRSTTDIEWVRFEPHVRRHFALGEEDFINLVDEAQEYLFDAPA